MVYYLILLLLSFILTFLAFLPLINFLYKRGFKNPEKSSKDFLGRHTDFNKFHGHKTGTPIGGGIPIVALTIIIPCVYSYFTKGYLDQYTIILALTLLLFGLLGFLDDSEKILRLNKKRFSALRVRHKLLIQMVFSLLISILFFNAGQRFSLGVILTILYSTFYITFFANAFNITDGLDGLAGGLLIVVLVPLWIISSGNPQGDSIIVFIATMMGASLAFMYFNISPARIFMGDTGALAMGAFIALVSTLLDASISFIVIGGVFVIEGISSLMQWASLALRDGKRIFKLAPIHHHFEVVGWEETKIVMRFWLAGAMFSITGLLLHFLIS